MSLLRFFSSGGKKKRKKRSCLRILSGGEQIPSDGEVDEGQECVVELQAGDWSPQSVPLSLWMILMPPWCCILDKMPALPRPPGEIPVS